MRTGRKSARVGEAEGLILVARLAITSLVLTKSQYYNRPGVGRRLNATNRTDRAFRRIGSQPLSCLVEPKCRLREPLTARAEGLCTVAVILLSTERTAIQ